MKTPTATPTLIEELKTCGMRYITQDGVDVISEAAERLGELEKDKADLHKLAAELSAENAALKARIKELEKSMEYSDSRSDHS